MSDTQFVVIKILTFLPVLLFAAHAEIIQIRAQFEWTTTRVIQSLDRCTSLIEREMTEANRQLQMMERSAEVLADHRQK